MAIKTGRYGQVLYDPTGIGTPAVIVSLNAWKLSTKTDKEDVTAFGDTNKVYVPGMKDTSGSVGGFWNSVELTLFEAADADTPGLLQLVPNNTEPTFGWEGLAYLDADIDCTLSAPKITGTWMAAGPWTGPAGFGSLMATSTRTLAP
jgi:hypothetical protein